MEIDTDEMRRLVFNLRLVQNGYSDVTKNTINQMAYMTQRVGRRNTLDDFVIRNRYTVSGVLHTKTDKNVISEQVSEAGSVRPYMTVQEFGGRKVHKPNAKSVPLPTNFSAGLPDGGPRTRLPRRRYSLSKLRLSRYNVAKKARTQRQLNAIMINMALANETGFSYAYLNFGRGKKQGIFEVFGSRGHSQVNMLYNLSKRSVRIPKKSWFESAREQGTQSANRIFVRSLKYTLRKNGFR